MQSMIPYVWSLINFSGFWVSALLAALVEDSSSSDVLALNPTIPSGVLRFMVATGRVVLVGNSALQPAPA